MSPTKIRRALQHHFYRPPDFRAQEAVDSLKVDKVIIADSSPAIDRIINTFNQNEERNLQKGKGGRITRTKLKAFRLTLPRLEFLRIFQAGRLISQTDDLCIYAVHV